MQAQHTATTTAVEYAYKSALLLSVGDFIRRGDGDWQVRRVTVVGPTIRVTLWDGQIVDYPEETALLVRRDTGKLHTGDRAEFIFQNAELTPQAQQVLAYQAANQLRQREAQRLHIQSGSQMDDGAQQMRAERDRARAEREFHASAISAHREPITGQQLLLYGLVAVAILVVLFIIFSALMQTGQASPSPFLSPSTSAAPLLPQLK